MSSVKTTPRVGARPSTRSSPKMPCSTSPGASTMAATRSIASQARSRLLTLTFDISQLPGPRNWAMAGGSNGYRAALVRRQLTPGLISSLPRAAGLPPYISFSTSYRELDSAVRRPMLRIGKRRAEYFAVAEAALLGIRRSWRIGSEGAEADDGEVAARLGTLFAEAEEEIGAAGGAEVAEEDILGVA